MFDFQLYVNVGKNPILDGKKKRKVVKMNFYFYSDGTHQTENDKPTIYESGP